MLTTASRSSGGSGTTSRRDCLARTLTSRPPGRRRGASARHARGRAPAGWRRPPVPTPWCWPPLFDCPAPIGAGGWRAGSGGCGRCAAAAVGARPGGAALPGPEPVPTSTRAWWEEDGLVWRGRGSFVSGDAHAGAAADAAGAARGRHGGAVCAGHGRGRPEGQQDLVLRDAATFADGYCRAMSRVAVAGAESESGARVAAGETGLDGEGRGVRAGAAGGKNPGTKAQKTAAGD
eukprot:ctg_1073.g449